MDERAIRQVILNLVSNAIKYTDEGGEVVVSCELSEDFASIMVRDTGTGISESDQELIFREFVQVANEDPQILAEPYHAPSVPFFSQVDQKVQNLNHKHILFVY